MARAASGVACGEVQSDAQQSDASLMLARARLAAAKVPCHGPEQPVATPVPVEVTTIRRKRSPTSAPSGPHIPEAMPASTSPPSPPRPTRRGFFPGRKRGSRGKLLTKKAEKLAAAALRASRAAGASLGGGPAVVLGGAAAPSAGEGPFALNSAAEGTDAPSQFRVPVGLTAAAMRKNLLPCGPGFLIHRSAVPSSMCVRVLRTVVGLASSLYHIIFNHKTIDDFERSGTTVESIMAPGGGGRLMAKLGGLVPRWLGATCNDTGASKAGILPDAHAQLWADFCMIAVVFKVVAGEAFGHGGYQCVYGPSLLQSWGECPAQLPHIDQSAPVDGQERAKKLLRANPDKPNLSLLVALQDNTHVVVFPHSHQYLPKVSGGRLSMTIHPVTVILSSGDVLLFRQDLVHNGAPSTGDNPSVLSCPTVIVPRASTYAGWGEEISNVPGIGLVPNSHRGLSERIASRRRSVSDGAQLPRAAPAPVATRAGCPDRPHSRLMAPRPRHPLHPLAPHVRCFSALAEKRRPPARGGRDGAADLMMSLSASTPHLGSGFLDFCLAAPAFQDTVPTGAITRALVLLFFLPLIGVGLATASPSLVLPPPNPPLSHPTASVASFGAVSGAGVGPGGSLVVLACVGSGSAGGRCDTGHGHKDGVGGVADDGGGRPPHRPSPIHDHGVTADGRGGHAGAGMVATAMDGVGSDDGVHVEVYDSKGPSSPWRRHAARRDAFRPATIRAVRATRPAIFGFSLPPDHSASPAPFEVVGDTRFAGVVAPLGDTAAAELSCVYNVAAWLQQLHNRQRSRECADERAVRAVSSFDIHTRVALHQLFTLVSSKYKVLTLATYDKSAAAVLHRSAFGGGDGGDRDGHCRAWDFLEEARTTRHVRTAVWRHGARRAASIVKGTVEGEGNKEDRNKGKNTADRPRQGRRAKRRA